MSDNMRTSKENSSVQMMNAVNLLPFIATIMETLMLMVPLVFEKYDGSTDPNEHLKMFVN